MELHPLLSNCFFEPLTPAARQSVATSVIEIERAAGTVIFEEGDEADAVYLVCSGTVELLKLAGGMREERISLVETGNYFGEVGVIDGSGRSTAARAQTPVTLAKVPAELLMRILREAPGEVTMHYLRRVSHHLRSANDRFIDTIARRDKMQLIGEMATTISHDIKSPIVGVGLATELMLREHKSERMQQLTALVQRQCDIINSLVQELLDFSKGRCDLVRQPTNLQTFFHEFRDLNENYLQKSGVRLTIECPPFVVAIDRNRLNRVFQNLLNNAVEALQRQQDPHILIRLEQRAAQCVELQVRDNGPGIPPAIQNSLFEPFVSHGKNHGTGLGMAIARSIVEAHGGSIRFESSPQEGTTFFIQLPVTAVS